MISTDMGYALSQPGRPSEDTVVRTPACRSWRVSIAGPADYPALAQLVIRTDPRQSGSADFEFLVRTVFPVCHTMLIRDGADPVGLLARRRDWIEMLYVTYRLQGCGIGSAFADCSQA